MRRVTARAAHRLYGRDAVLKDLWERLDRATSVGASLRVVGEPGIGKTALVDAIADRAAAEGWCIIRTAGTQLESHIPFAGLHLLLRGRIDQVDRLHSPSRRALLTAIGATDGAAPEPFLLGVGVLDLLVQAAAEQPTLVIIDDAHLLDPESASVLAFVARRIAADPIFLVAAERAGSTNALTETITDTLQIAPISPRAAGELLDASEPASGIEDELRRQVLEWAEGNPLALIELPKAAGGGHVEEDLSIAPVVPLTARLRRAFSSRSLALPEPTRAVLTCAALNDEPDLKEALGAASILIGAPVWVKDATLAVEAGLVIVADERIEFRHALMRVALADELETSDRLRVHEALATAVRNKDRAAWHRAYAATGPNEQLAVQLDALANAARRRGGISVALAAGRRAAMLTEDPGALVNRLLLSAELAYELGNRGLVEEILNEVQQLDIGPVEQGRVDYLSEAFTFRPWTRKSILEIADRAAKVSQAGATDLALKLLVGALQRSYWAEPGPHALHQVLAVAERFRVPRDDPLMLTVLAHAAPVERGGEVLAIARKAVEAVGADYERLYMLVGAGGYVGDPHLDARYAPDAIAGLRRQGHASRAVHAMYVHATWCYFTGEWSEGIIAAAEGATLAEQTSQLELAEACRILEAQFEALRGNSEQARRLLLPEPNRRTYYWPPHTERAHGIVALAAGDRRVAYAHLRQLFLPGAPAYHSWLRIRAVTELAEAASSPENRAEARALLADLETIAAQTPSPLLHASLVFARPWLADDEQAEPLFRAASDLEPAKWPFMWARNRLAYGAWLRRQRNVARSREPLRQAREIFEQLGAAPWAQRARLELRAAGEASPETRADRSAGLTPQELQIATLAASGLTNRQIAERLFLSHRTVGTYLYQVFPKLGVSSRAQLSRVLTHPGQAVSQP